MCSTRKPRTRQLAVWGMVAALLGAVGCTEDPQTVTEPSQESPVSVVEPLPEPTVAPEADRFIELTPDDPVDVATAQGLSEAADGLVEEGYWFADGFTDSVAFSLPIDGHLKSRGLGYFELELGPSDAPLGLLRVIEAVALSSPNGPIPISQVGPDKEFSDATKLAQGSAVSGEVDLSWTDLVINADGVPDVFEERCPWSDGDCVGALITDAGPVQMEMDRPHRIVGQDWGDHRLYVVATDLRDSGSATEVTTELGQAAFDVAGSIVPTDRVEASDERYLSELGLRADEVPAGTWRADLATADVRFDLETPVTGAAVRFLNPSYFGFESASGDGRFFFVSRFPGFVDGVDMRIPSIEDPLTAHEFLAGMEQIVAVTATFPVSIGGLDGVGYEIEIPAESDYPCPAPERAFFPAGADCVVFSRDGWMMVDDGTEAVGIYIEDAGLEVSYAADEQGQPLGELASLVEAMTIEPK